LFSASDSIQRRRLLGGGESGLVSVQALPVRMFFQLDKTRYETANRLADLGFAPFVPHGTHFWHMLFPRPYEFWLDLDNQFLPFCEAIYRLPGASSGADKEVLRAQQLNIPVFTDIDDLVRHFEERT
jgi:hypothetical protein